MAGTSPAKTTLGAVPQEAAVKAGLLEGRSLVISSPTASGKTLVAMLAAYKKIREGRKVVYLSPLRALASEKYAEFKKLERFGMRCAIATGDFDASGEVLGKFDLPSCSRTRSSTQSSDTG